MAKRLAIVSSGFQSPLSSALEFAQRARTLGYEVRLFAPEWATELIAHCGFAHHVIPPPHVDAFSPLLSRAEIKALSPKARRDASIEALGVEGFAHAVTSFAPDAIFIDAELHAHIIVALSLDVPVVQYSNMFISPPGTRAPPLNKRAHPGYGLPGSRFGVSLLWARFFLWKFSKILRNRIKFKGADYATVHRELARRTGVPLAQKLRLICWQMPWTYKIPTVLLLPKALDLPTQLPDDFTYLGPMILTDRPERAHDREKIHRFCRAGDTRKRIFVGFGTMMKPKSALLAHLWTVAGKHPEWQFLFAAGKNWQDADGVGYPPNVDIVEWAPQHQVLRHADLAIMHGGIGGVVEAVEAATPMLLYPHVNDQHGNAARVVYHGIGREGARTDTADRIEADIQALLKNPGVPKTCATLQAACQADTENRALDRYLRSLIGNGSATPR